MKYAILLISILTSCKSVQKPNSESMKLWTLSNYGEKEKTISENVTNDDIDRIMNSLNWNEFHQVILEKKNGDFIEVSGNLGEDGLSVLYQEGENQKVIVIPPTTISEMIYFLKSYMSGNEEFKSKYEFE